MALQVTAIRRLLGDLVALRKQLPDLFADRVDEWIANVHSEMPRTRGALLDSSVRGPFCAACRPLEAWPCQANAFAVGRMRRRRMRRMWAADAVR